MSRWWYLIHVEQATWIVISMIFLADLNVCISDLLIWVLSELARSCPIKTIAVHPKRKTCTCRRIACRKRLIWQLLAQIVINIRQYQWFLIRHILNSLSALFPMKDIVIITRYLFRKYDVFVTRYHLKKNFIGWNGCKTI